MEIRIYYTETRRQKAFERLVDKTSLKGKLFDRAFYKELKKFEIEIWFIKGDRI